MTKTSAGSKAGTCRQTAWRHDGAVGLRKINDLGEMRIRFRFVLMTKVNGERVVDDFEHCCGWTPAPVARIPQITSLRPGKP